MKRILGKNTTIKNLLDWSELTFYLQFKFIIEKMSDGEDSDEREMA